MLNSLLRSPIWGRALSKRAQILIAAAVVAVATGGAYPLMHDRSEPKVELSSQAKRSQRFAPTEAQWATLTVEPVEKRVFRSEHVTEGKIAVDEDRSTPIFSPYAGRVMRLFAKPGDTIERGQPLFTVEAADMVQAQNDFITAATALNKARSQLNLAQIIDKRQRDLFEGKAVPLKEVQNARAALDAAENDVRSGEVALEAARNRLRILGKTDQEITDFQNKGSIDPATPIYAPIGGTIVQRKVGPGQYIGNGSSDPVFVIGDLSTVWLIAYVRETEAPKIQIGQSVKFTVLSYPDQTFTAAVSYVAASLDPTTRRLLVRATVQNPARLLKLEMFANVTLLTGEGEPSPSIPRDAVLYEGEQARVWVVKEDRSIELRQIKTGLVNGKTIQVIDGLKVGEKVITKGSLFIDRAAAGS
ncbi:MAG: efflux RND transporter periplasmic adaptor subunit [Pseudomonadota bacterium]